MKIRPYNPGDEQQILEMDWLLFPDPWNKRNLDNWRWKHAGNNPAGKAIIYVMENEGKIIAHFAVVPYRLRVFGENVLASHSIGSMVLPEYQGKGLIKFVADKLFEEVMKKRIAFSYGFPNILAYDLHKKLMGYNDVAQISTMEKSTSATKEVLSASNLRAGFLPIQRFDSAVDALWERVKDDHKISVIRDAAFLNWRYLERPDQKYYAFGHYEDDSLAGYVILKLYKDAQIIKGHIVDILSLSGREDIALSLIEASGQFFGRNKADLQSAWVAGSRMYNDILSAQGFRPVRPRPLICRINIDKEKYGRVLDGTHWYFTMGDTTEIF